MKFEEVLEIAKEFPYLLCVKEEKLEGCLDFFKNQRLLKEDISRILKRAGGVLGIQKTAIKGIYETMKNVASIDEKEFTELV